MPPNKLIVLSAPTGSGKNTIANMLMEEDKRFEETISCTTRRHREGEKNAVHYYFISEDEFKEKIKNEDFVEWEKVHDKFFYGTLKAEIERIVKKGKIPILVIEVNGGRNIKKIFPDSILVFIKPNSFENIESRIRKRAKISEEEVRARLKTAKNELKMSKYYDCIITNPEGHPEEAVEELKNIIEKHICLKKY
ncbi:MAG: guanylate kinase [bacterium]